jgi:ParB family chromosome partitioning protein
MTRKALGRGLDALIPRADRSEEGGREALPAAIERGMIQADLIRQNPWQPRRVSDPLKLEELARSVRLRGILEPLLVRKVGDAYELVAGERRLRAAQIAGIQEVPAIIVDLDDKASLEVALVENIQREDLNPVDEARAYQEFSRTHDEIATQVGKDRSTVTNLLRLLRLPSLVLDLVAQEKLTVGHARVLLVLTHSHDQEIWGQRIADQGWSVRETERRIANLVAPPGSTTHSIAANKDVHLERVEEAIRRRIGTEVHLHHGRRGGGRLELVYADQEQLERILDILGVQVH